MNEIDDIFEDINQLLIEPEETGGSTTLKASSSKDSLERQIADVYHIDMSDESS